MKMYDQICKHSVKCSLHSRAGIQVRLRKITLECFLNLKFIINVFKIYPKKMYFKKKIRYVVLLNSGKNLHPC